MFKCNLDELRSYAKTSEGFPWFYTAQELVPLIPRCSVVFQIQPPPPILNRNFTLVQPAQTVQSKCR
jgi:hypothetical protein